MEDKCELIKFMVLWFGLWSDSRSECRKRDDCWDATLCVDNYSITAMYATIDDVMQIDILCREESKYAHACFSRQGNSFELYSRGDSASIPLESLFQLLGYDIGLIDNSCDIEFPEDFDINMLPILGVLIKNHPASWKLDTADYDLDVWVNVYPYGVDLPDNRGYAHVYLYYIEERSGRIHLRATYARSPIDSMLNVLRADYFYAACDSETVVFTSEEGYLLRDVCAMMNGASLNSNRSEDSAETLEDAADFFLD